MTKVVNLNTVRKQRGSAASSVQLSGFELVRKRKPRGKIASVRDYANVHFEPWTRSADMGPTELLPADDALLNCGEPARLAYAVMLRSRQQLIGMFDKTDEKHIEQMMDRFTETAEWLKVMVHILESATQRVLAAGSAHVIGGGRTARVRAS